MCVDVYLITVNHPQSVIFIIFCIFMLIILWRYMCIVHVVPNYTELRGILCTINTAFGAHNNIKQWNKFSFTISMSYHYLFPVQSWIYADRLLHKIFWGASARRLSGQTVIAWPIRPISCCLFFKVRIFKFLLVVEVRDILFHRQLKKKKTGMKISDIYPWYKRASQ